MVVGCGPLIDEAVVGADVGVLLAEGKAGSELGASVLLHQGEIVAGAPGEGAVYRYDASGQELYRIDGGPRFGQKLFVWGDDLFVWQAGEGVYTLEGDQAVLIVETEAPVVAVGPDGTIHEADEGEAVSVSGEGRVVRTRCDGHVCEVEVDGEVLAETSVDSDVGFDGGVACWGDAGWPDDPASGVVSCEDGAAVEGLDGDHMGNTVADGWAAGVFNKWQVPARTRIVALGGDEVLAVERAAERSPVALADDGTLLVVGVPGFLRSHAEQGAVYLVDR